MFDPERLSFGDVERIQDSAKLLLRDLDNAVELSKCDFSALGRDYWCVRRISISGTYEVWEADDIRNCETVSVMLVYQSSEVCSPEIAEKLIEDQAMKAKPISRGGRGYASYLVYPLNKGASLGHPSRVPYALAASFTVLVATFLLYWVWPTPITGIIDQSVFDSQAQIVGSAELDGGITFHIDYDPTGNRAVWSCSEGTIRLSIDGETTEIAHVDGGYTFSLDLSPTRNEALVVDCFGAVLVASKRGSRKVRCGYQVRQAWFSKSGLSAYVLSKDSTKLSRINIDTGDTEVSWKLSGATVLRANSDPDVFAVFEEAGVVVYSQEGQKQYPKFENPSAFDAHGGLIAFGSLLGQLRAHRSGKTYSSDLLNNASVFRIRCTDDQIYLASRGGMYAIQVGKPDQVFTLSGDRIADTYCQSLEWNPNRQLLTAATSSGVYQWSDARSH